MATPVGGAEDPASSSRAERSALATVTLGSGAITSRSTPASEDSGSDASSNGEPVACDLAAPRGSDHGGAANGTQVAARAHRALSANDETVATGREDAATTPRALTLGPPLWLPPSSVLLADIGGVVHRFPMLEGSRDFDREILRSAAAHIRGPDHPLLGASEAIQRARAAQSPWEEPVDHVVRGLFTSSTPHLGSTILSRVSDEEIPPVLQTTEHILSQVARATSTYADLAGLYGEERLFDRVVGTARACALLSHLVSSLLDVACASESQTEPGGDHTLTIANYERRLQSAERLNSWFARKARQWCDECRSNRDTVVDLQNAAAYLESAKTSLALQNAGMEVEVHDLREQLETRDQELTELREKLGGLQDRLADYQQLQLQASERDRLKETVKRQATEIQTLVDRSKRRAGTLKTREEKIAEQERTIQAQADEIALLRSQEPAPGQLTDAQRQHVYQFCWENATALGAPEAWWRLVCACATNDSAMAASNPTQLVVSSAPHFASAGAPPDPSTFIGVESRPPDKSPVGAHQKPVNDAPNSSRPATPTQRRLWVDDSDDEGPAMQEEKPHHRSGMDRLREETFSSTSTPPETAHGQHRDSSARKASRDATAQLHITTGFIRNPATVAVEYAPVVDRGVSSAPPSPAETVDLTDETGVATRGDVVTDRELIQKESQKAPKNAAKRPAVNPTSRSTLKKAKTNAPSVDDDPDTDPVTGFKLEMIRLWCKKPRRPARSPVTEFDFVIHPQAPFPLGMIRSKSSTLRYQRPVNKHRESVGGFSTQRLGTQTAYFPNYEPSRTHSKPLVERICTPTGRQQVIDLLDARPWDAMWKDRVRLFFLVDPATLSDDQLLWVGRRFQFQYEYRQALWFYMHWLSLPKATNLPIDVDPWWHTFLKRRDDLKSRLRRAAQALDAEAPPGVWMPLLQCEPSIWVEPTWTCFWAPDPLDESTLLEQLEKLDEEEPIRCFWTKQPGRFVEALLPDQIKIMREHGGRCYELLDPWINAAHEPVPLDTPTDGTPGPSFLTQVSSSTGSQTGATQANLSTGGQTGAQHV